MKQFDLSLWLQDKSQKIVTRNGRPVRIVCWDSPNKIFPIVGFVNNKEEIFVWDCFGYYREGHIESDFDLFFADEKKTNKILDELKSYLKNTPKEQVEKDWKEIQDWYVQHFTNEKRDWEEELTEFERTLSEIIDFWQRDNGSVLKTQSKLRSDAKTLIDLARKELEKDIEHSAVEFAKSYMEDVNPSFEKVKESEELWKWKMSCLSGINKAYKQGKEDALKDLPKWKKANEHKDLEKHIAILEEDKVLLSNYLEEGDYYIELDDLKTLPKEE